MADVSAIRVALAANLSAIPDLQVSPYMLSDPSPPCGMIYHGRDDLMQSFGRGFDQLSLTIRIIVPFGSDIGSQVNLDAYRSGSGARSIKQAAESNPTLGGVVEKLDVTEISPDTVYASPSGATLGIGCEFTVAILARGTS